jgi:MYXO-CTERM domain-containing protein
MTRTVLASTLSLGLLLSSSAARADLAPPNSTECDGKNAGDACTDDTMAVGACAEMTCSELDYSHGSPPSTKQVPCLLCVAGNAPVDSSKNSSCALAVPSGPGALAVAALAIPFVLRRRRRAR